MNSDDQTQPNPGQLPGDRPSPLRERILDLLALLLLIALAAVVFTVAGASAFTAVTSVGLGLFAAWRARPRTSEHQGLGAGSRGGGRFWSSFPCCVGHPGRRSRRAPAGAGSSRMRFGN